MAAYVVIVLAVILMVLLILKRRKSKLTHIPGFSSEDSKGNIRSVNFYGRQASAVYGNVYLMWSEKEPIVIIADKEIARKYYKDHLNHPRDEDFSLGPTMKCLLGNAIGTKYGKKWSEHKTALKFMLTISFINYWESNISILCKKYVDDMLKDNEINIVNSIKKFTLKVLSKVMYGYLTTEEEEELIKLSDQHDKLLTTLFFTEAKTCAEFEESWKQFNKSFIENPQPETGIWHMTKSKLTEKEILGNMNEILLFNIDVMYSALGALLINLSRHPEYQKLELIDQVILESSRISPSLHLSFPERTAVNGQIGQYYVPSETLVLIDIDTINHCDSSFHNPDEFVLGRNLTSNNYHRFGLGSRKCLGHKFAQIILQKCAYNFINRCVLLPTNKEIGIKKEGIIFFTPYFEFPTISITYHSTVLCGISLGNSYYTKININKIFSYWNTNTPHLVTFIPDLPSYHTVKAKNMSKHDDEILKKCSRDSKVLHTRAKEAAKNKKFKFEGVTWECLIKKHSILYEESLNLVIKEYCKDGVLAHEVNDVTSKVVGVDGNVQEGAKFLLKELAMIRIAPELLSVESVIYSYHLDFPIIEKMIYGELGDLPAVHNVYVKTVG